MKKYTILSFLLTCFLFCNAQKEVDKVPLDLKVFDLEGNPKTLNEIVNHEGLVLLDFWATWCKPCILELNSLKEVTPLWEEEYNAKVVLISIDDYSKIERIKAILNKKEIDYDIYIDKDRESRAKMGVKQIPNMYLVDKDGNIIKKELKEKYWPTAS